MCHNFLYNTCAALFKVLLATIFCNEAKLRNKAALREVNQGIVYKIEVDLRSVVLNLEYIATCTVPLRGTWWSSHGVHKTLLSHEDIFEKKSYNYYNQLFKIIIVVITHVVILGTIKNGDINLVKIAAGVFEGNSHVPRHPLTL